MSRQSDDLTHELPDGTVTFLFTDIEDSTKLLHDLGEKYISLLTNHHRILRDIISRWNGREVDTEGDAFFVSFPRATDAVAAVVEAQRSLTSHIWPGDVTVRVRMGLHTGEPWTGSSGYVGMDVHRAARIAHVGHGGQVLLSETTAPLLRGNLPNGVTLRDLGQHRLKDMQFPEHIRQLVIDGLPVDFPPLKSLEVITAIDEADQEPLLRPAFLTDNSWRPSEEPVFVARNRELEWLADHLDSALSNHGKVIFVTGEAGQGKTTLLRTFARQAVESNQDLLIAWGRCNAFSGRGDPFHPLREIVAQLSGDVEGSWRSRLLNDEETERLWMAMPDAIDALMESGSSIIDTFIPADKLLKRLAEAAPQDQALQNRLRDLIRSDRLHGEEGGRSEFFEHVVQFFIKMALNYPLLLIIDDLQWVDRGSIDLLFHLGRSLPGSRILIVSSFRPEDVISGQDGRRHPLKPLIDEFKRLFGAVSLDLAKSEGRSFIEAFLDSAPNDLEPAFRDDLYRRTGGHALFTVELIRDLKERGDLTQDEEGLWLTTDHLDWDRLPARIEGVIESRIGRLENSQRDILTVGSVEGESFTTMVVAKIHQMQERQLLRNLSQDLETRHRLVEERQSLTVGKHLLARFRFSHAIFQRYFYNNISQVERRYLHLEIATILEEIYGAERDRFSVQLARHYIESGEDERAIEYLLLAGDQARTLYAHQEAIIHYKEAIKILSEGGDRELTARAYMKLGLTYHNAFEYEKSRRAYEQGFALWQQVGYLDSTELSPAPHGLRLIGFQPLTLDPGLRIDHVIKNLFSGLTRVDPQMDILPDVAHGWDVLNGGRQYVFHLREDVLWSDGSPVTSADFEYAWKRILDPSTESVLADLYYDIKNARPFHKGSIVDSDLVGVRSPDDLTLEVELDEPTGYFLQLLSTAYPVPCHIVREQGNTWAEADVIVSNGPFLLKAWESNETSPTMRFEANPTYHGRHHGNVHEVDISFYVEYEDHSRNDFRKQRLSMYEEDLLDHIILQGLDPVEALRARNQHSGDLQSFPLLSSAFLVFNTLLPPFDDSRIRQAFAYATDLEHWANVVIGGLHFPATGSVIPPGMPGHAEGIALPYDPEKARCLLAEAGYPRGNGFPEILYQHRYWGEWSDRQEAYLGSLWLENLGVEVSFETLIWSEFRNRTNRGNQHMHVTGYGAEYPDPDSFLRLGIRNLQPSWQNAHYEKLIEQARIITNQHERLKLYSKAQSILIDEMPVLPIYYRRALGLLKPWVVKAPFDPLTEGWFWEDVVIDPH